MLLLLLLLFFFFFLLGSTRTMYLIILFLSLFLLILLIGTKNLTFIFLSLLFIVVMVILFVILAKTTVAGFEPTPPEEKWFQVTRLRPLGHTVFVFIWSFLFMYFNNVKAQILFPLISVLHWGCHIHSPLLYMCLLKLFPS